MTLSLKAVQLNGLSSNMHLKALKKDKTIVSAALTQSTAALPFVDEVLRDDARIMELALGKTDVLKYAGPSLKDNHDFVLSAVQFRGLELEHASDKLKKDTAIVSAALTQNAAALSFVDEALRDDVQIMELALGKKVYVLKHAGPSLKDNYDFVLSAVQFCGLELEHASEKP